MIDIESQIFQKCADVFRAVYTNGFIAGEYVPKPPKFPAVSVVEMDNSVYQPGSDSGAVENFVSVMYQVDVYSNLNTGKKAQTKAIIALLDAVFARYGFTRMSLVPVPNMNEPTIYRMTARYRAVASTDNIIYRR